MRTRSSSGPGGAFVHASPPGLGKTPNQGWGRGGGGGGWGGMTFGPGPWDVPPFPPLPGGEVDEPWPDEPAECDSAPEWAEAALVLRFKSSTKPDESLRSRIPSASI